MQTILDGDSPRGWKYVVSDNRNSPIYAVKNDRYAFSFYLDRDDEMPVVHHFCSDADLMNFLDTLDAFLTSIYDCDIIYSTIGKVAKDKSKNNTSVKIEFRQPNTTRTFLVLEKDVDLYTFKENRFDAAVSTATTELLKEARDLFTEQEKDDIRSLIKNIRSLYDR